MSIARIEQREFFNPPEKRLSFYSITPYPCQAGVKDIDSKASLNYDFRVGTNQGQPGIEANRLRERYNIWRVAVLLIVLCLAVVLFAGMTPRLFLISLSIYIESWGLTKRSSGQPLY